MRPLPPAAAAGPDKLWLRFFLIDDGIGSRAELVVLRPRAPCGLPPQRSSSDDDAHRSRSRSAAAPDAVGSKSWSRSSHAQSRVKDSPTHTRRDGRCLPTSDGTPVYSLRAACDALTDAKSLRDSRGSIIYATHIRYRPPWWATVGLRSGGTVTRELRKRRPRQYIQR